MEEVTDPAEVSKARIRRAQLDRNVAWLRTHAAEVYEKYRGKFICVAGEQVFADDTSEGARALADAVHPADQGSFVLYIPKDKDGPRLCSPAVNGSLVPTKLSAL